MFVPVRWLHESGKALFNALSRYPGNQTREVKKELKLFPDVSIIELEGDNNVSVKGEESMSKLEMITANWLRQQIQTLQDAQNKGWKADVADKISELRKELNKVTSYK